MSASAALALAALVAMLAAASPAAAQSCPPLQLGGQALSFSQCVTVPGIGDNFQLFWTLSPGSTNVSWGMSTTGKGYGKEAQAPCLLPFAVPLQACACPCGSLRSLGSSLRSLA